MAMIQNYGFYWFAVLWIMLYLALCGHSLNVSNYKWCHSCENINHLCVNMTEEGILECSHSCLVNVSFDWNGSMETFHLCGNTAFHNCSGFRGILTYNNTNQTISGKEHILKSNVFCRFVGTNFTKSNCFLSEDGNLDCSERNVTSLNITGSDFIVGLNLSYNLLESTPFLRNCSKIEWIDMSHNHHLQRKVLTTASFEGLASASLTLLNITNCDIIFIQPVPLDHFFPSLQTLLLSNNSLSKFNVSSFSNLTAFRLLDLRDNEFSQEYIFPCILTSKNAIILVNELDCSLSCVQDFMKENQDLEVLLPSCEVRSTTGEGDLESTSLVPTTGDKGSGSKIPEHLILPVTITLGSILLLGLVCVIIVKKIRAWRKQNQYNRWLAVYTPKNGLSIERIK